MILRTLYLKIGDLGLPVDYTYGFLKGSRHVCNFIEREVLKPIRFNTENFDRIVVALCTVPREEVYVNSSSVAEVQITFDRDAYDATPRAELPLFYVHKLKDGMEKCARSLEIPKAEISDGLATFVAGGMLNEWIFKDKSFKTLKLRAVLGCQLSLDAFRLRLQVFHVGKLAFDEEILKTDPDEIAFEPLFKDIKVEGSDLVVTGKRGPPLWMMPLSRLTASP
jgi:hypothetical protein